MDTTTATASPSGAGVQSPSPAPADDADLESLADGLMDRIFPQDEETDPNTGEPVQKQGTQQQGTPDEQHQDDGQQKEEGQDDPAKQQADPNKKPEDEAEEYESLDAFLTANKIDPESFKQLPVTVKVDGKEEPIPLAEVVKGYQLAQASYNRMNEVAQERTAFTAEQTQVRQALGVQIQRAEAILKLAHDTLMGDFAPYTPQVLAQLRAENPGEYAAVQQSFQARQGAIAQALQQIDAARKEQAQGAETQRRASLAGEQAKLLKAIPEWRDPAKAAADTTAMRAYGTKLGFTDAELSGIYDHRYMQVLRDAALYAQLQASQSATVRRVRTAPRMVKPGTRTAPANPKVASYSQALDRALKNPTSDTALAAAFSHF